MEREPTELDLSPGEEALIREVADMFREMMPVTIEQGAATANWLLASLLAVNGGSIALILPLGEADPFWVSCAGISWVVGILLALATGFSGYSNTRVFAAELGALWTDTMRAIHLKRASDLSFETFSARHTQKASTTMAIGLASVVAWIGGVICAAIAL